MQDERFLDCRLSLEIFLTAERMVRSRSSARPVLRYPHSLQSWINCARRSNGRSRLSAFVSVVQLQPRTVLPLLTGGADSSASIIWLRKSFAGQWRLLIAIPGRRLRDLGSVPVAWGGLEFLRQARFSRGKGKGG